MTQAELAGFIRSVANLIRLPCRFPKPSFKEQNQIVEYLDAVFTKPQKPEDSLRHSVALLQKRRTALIIAVVTGQNGVAGAN